MGHLSGDYLGRGQVLIMSQGPDPDILSLSPLQITYFVVRAEEVVKAGSEICSRNKAPVSL